MLVLSNETLADLRARARAAAPAECCGLLIGREARGRIEVTGLRPVSNDAPDRYRIPPATLIAAERAARAVGDWVCGSYHSHPEDAAVPSRTDRELAWPGFIYVIVAGRAGPGDNDIRAWRLTDERHFSEVGIEAAWP